tara:strand:+ start:90 stop:1796 length:1707 start_codon:yes stop_codon:yes gene_type:complete
MPYIDKQPAIGDTTTDNDVLTRGEAKVLIEKLLSNSLFHELEPVEVLDVYVNPSDPSYDETQTYKDVVPEEMQGETGSEIGLESFQLDFLDNEPPYLNYKEPGVPYTKQEQIDFADILPLAKNPSFLGAIRGRYVVSEQGDSIDETKIFRPLDPNIIQYPVIGEVVLGLEFAGKHYYFSKLNDTAKVQHLSKYGISNLHNETANESAAIITNSIRRAGRYDPETGNEITGSYKPEELENNPSIFSTVNGAGVIPLGLYFEEDYRAFRLRPEEGDTILQGRFGNSIRLGNTNRKNRQDPYGIGVGLVNSSNVKITAGSYMYGLERNPDGSIYRVGFEGDYVSELGANKVNGVHQPRVEEDIRTHVENLQHDDASLYLTSNENIDLPEPAVFLSDFVVDKEYKHPQAILCSDRIIINAKKPNENRPIASFKVGRELGKIQSQVLITSDDKVDIISNDIHLRTQRERYTTDKKLDDSSKQHIYLDNGGIRVSAFESTIYDNNPAVKANEDFDTVINIILDMQITTKRAELLAEVAKPFSNPVTIAELEEEVQNLNRIKNEKSFYCKNVNVE